MENVKVREIGQTLTGFAFDSNCFNDKEGFPIIRIRDLRTHSPQTYYNGPFDPKYIVKKGDLLIGMDGEFNLIEWAGNDAILNQRVCKLIIDEQKAHRLYIKYALPKKLKDIEDTTPYVTVKHLSNRQVLEIDLPLPDKITQKQIAQILEEANTARQKRKDANALTDQFLQSTFLSMFGDPVQNTKHWKKSSIRSLATKYSDGPFGSNLKSEHYTPYGILVIRLENIGINHFKSSSLTYIPEEHYKILEKHTCLPGDVIIGTMGDPNLRACILPSHIKIAINKADCVLFRADKQKVLPEFVSYLLNIPSFLNLSLTWFWVKQGEG